MKRFYNLFFTLILFFYFGLSAQTTYLIQAEKSSKNLLSDFSYKNNLQILSVMDLPSTLVDSVICFNTSDELIEKHILQYDFNGLPINTVIMKMNGDTWNNSKQISCIRDLQGRIESVYEKKWDGTKWQDSLQILLTLDQNGNVLVSRYNYWKAGHYADSTIHTFTFNENDDILTNTWQLWNGTAWVNDYRQSNTWHYNLKYFERLDEVGIDGAWKNYARITCNYTLEPYKYDTRIQERWKNESWTVSSRNTCKYDNNGNEIEWQIEYFKNGQWENGHKNIHEYDSEGRLILDYEDTWKDNVWKNAWRMSYSYGTSTIEGVAELGEAGYWLPEFIYYTESYFGLWANCSKIILFIHGITDVANDLTGSLSEFSLSQNYPNPFNPETNIEYKLPKGGFVTLKVYDVLGREITTLVNEFKQAGVHQAVFSIDKLHLASGVYLYCLQAEKFILTKKMMLIK